MCLLREEADENATELELKDTRERGGTREHEEKLVKRERKRRKRDDDDDDVRASFLPACTERLE